MIAKELLLRRVHALPTISPVALQLIALVRDETASAPDFERVIRADPALAANVLRVANSAYFRRAREITSIQHAVTMLGLSRLSQIAATAAYARTLPDVIPGYQISAKSFFLHCAAVAVLSERLCAEFHLAVPDMTFTAGLLHDLGKLVIGTLLAERETEFAAELARSEAGAFDAERFVLGTEHGEIGAVIARTWNLPRAVEDVASFHHAPDDAPPHSALVDVVHVADALAHLLGFGADIAGLSRHISPGAVRRLGVRVQALERAAAQAVDGVQALGELYEPRTEKKR